MDAILRAFHTGGFAVMSGISFVFIISIAITLERMIRFWLVYDLSNSSGFMIAVQKMVMNNSIENAIRLCKKAGQSKLLPSVLAEGLKRANDTTEEIGHAMESATLSALAKAQSRVGFLATTANVATLLGLLGTIFGLMHSFAAAATATGAQKQTLLAEGIAEALTATSFGLSTALLCILAHGILSSKQQSLISDINQNTAKLNDLLYTRKMKLKGLKSEREES